MSRSLGSDRAQLRANDAKSLEFGHAARVALRELSAFGGAQANPYLARDDAPTMAVDGFTRKLWSEADRLALVAEFEHWGDTQVSFCEAKGVSTKTFRS